MAHLAESTVTAGGDISTGEGGPSPVLRMLIGLAAMVLIVFGMRSFSTTLGMAFLSLVLVITVHPIQGWLQRRNVPRWVGVVVLLAVVYALLLALAAALAFSLAQLASLLPSYSDQFTSLVSHISEHLKKIGVGQSQINEALSGLNASTALGVAQQLLTELASLTSDLVFVLLLLLFLAADAAAFPSLLARAAAERPQLVGALLEFAHGTRRFLVVSTIFGVIAAALQVGALYWLAVPLPLLWGLLSLIATYIANIGFLISVIPPALLALLQNGPTNALLVIAAYGVIAFVVQSVIQPKYVADAVGLSVTLTFFSLFFWGYALGSLGALLAVPLSLLVRAVLVDANPRAHWLLPLIAGTVDNPHASPPDLAEIELLAREGIDGEASAQAVGADVVEAEERLDGDAHQDGRRGVGTEHPDENQGDMEAVR